MTGIDHVLPSRDGAAPTGGRGSFGSGLSRRDLLRYASLVGAGAALGPVFGSGLAGASSAPRSASALRPVAAAASGVLNVNLNRNLVSLDNKLNQYDAAVTVQRAIRQALTKVGDDLAPELVLAESFEPTGDAEWTVTLRDDIVYSDGSPVTVEDVETALQYYFEVPSGFVQPQFPEPPSFAKVDDTTFTLTTSIPVVTMPSLMTNIMITPAATNRPEELQDGLGTGPFVVEADLGTGTYKFEPNLHYWGPDPAHVAEVNVTYTEDESASVIALETGQVDVIDTLSSDSAEYLRGKDGIELIESPGTRLIHLFYNFRLPADHPLSNPKVREALSHAVDHETLISALMAGQVSSARGVVPETLSGFFATGDYTYDPELTQSMLEAEGVTDLSLLAIWEEAEFAGAAQVMEALVTMLGDVGVMLELNQVPKGGEIAEWRAGDKSGDWHILGNGYGNQTGLALTNLVGQYAGTAEKEANKDTYHGFVVPEVTDLINEAGRPATNRRVMRSSPMPNSRSGTCGRRCGRGRPRTCSPRARESGR